MGGGPAASPLGISTLSPDKSKGGKGRGKLLWAKRHRRVARTEQLDFEPNLRQRLDEIRRFLRRNVPAIPPEHVQPIGPVRPARDVRGDRIGKRALRRDQREGQRRRYERRGGSAPRAIRRRGAIRRGDLCDEREIEAVGQVLEPATHRELGVTVDVMHVLQAVVLHKPQRGRALLACQDGVKQRTRRINRHCRAARRGAGAEIGTALRNHEP